MVYFYMPLFGGPPEARFRAPDGSGGP